MQETGLNMSSVGTAVASTREIVGERQFHKDDRKQHFQASRADVDGSSSTGPTAPASPSPSRVARAASPDDLYRSFSNGNRNSDAPAPVTKNSSHPISPLLLLRSSSSSSGGGGRSHAAEKKRQKPNQRQKTLSRRLNSVEAFFAWGTELKGAFSLGLAIPLEEPNDRVFESSDGRAGRGRGEGIPALLERAIAEASLLDQPLARGLVTRPASFVPFRLPRVVVPPGAPNPELVAVPRKNEDHWRSELERAVNTPFTSSEVVLSAGDDDGVDASERQKEKNKKKKNKKNKKKKTILAQRACSFVLLLNDDEHDNDDGNGDDDEDKDDASAAVVVVGSDDKRLSPTTKRRHELIARFNHALFDGRGALEFVCLVLRRYEALVDGASAAAAAAAAFADAAKAAAASAGEGGQEEEGEERDGVDAPARSRSPVSALSRWPSVASALGRRGGGSGSRSGSPSLSPSPSPLPSRSRSPSPQPQPQPQPMVMKAKRVFFSSSSSSFAQAPLPTSSPFKRLPPTSSTLCRKLGPRMFFTRIIAVGSSLVFHFLPRGEGDGGASRRERRASARRAASRVLFFRASSLLLAFLAREEQHQPPFSFTRRCCSLRFSRDKSSITFPRRALSSHSQPRERNTENILSPPNKKTLSEHHANALRPGDSAKGARAAVGGGRKRTRKRVGLVVFSRFRTMLALDLGAHAGRDAALPLRLPISQRHRQLCPGRRGDGSGLVRVRREDLREVWRAQPADAL
jgi:hypothetical protein